MQCVKKGGGCMVYKDNFYYFLYSELPFEEKQIYHCEIKEFVKRIAWEYYGFWNWFDNLFSEKYELDSTREIIICHSGLQMVGISILKRDLMEQKICTLRVSKEFQRRGIGKQLVELSLEWLQNDKPLITVHKSKSKEFESLFDRYGFVLEEKQKNYYHLFNTELVFNGTLPKKSLFLNPQEVFDLENAIKAFFDSGQLDFSLFLDKCIQQWWEREEVRKQIIRNY